MLRSKQVIKDTKLLVRSKEGRPIEILLAILSVFSKQGKDEVSLSEFQETVAEVQQKFVLGYSFSERFLLSSDLLSDLKELDYRGYTRDYHCRLDDLLPKRFISLTPLGRGQANRLLRALPDDIVEKLTSAVNIAMKNYKERWRLWAR